LPIYDQASRFARHDRRDEPARRHPERPRRGARRQPRHRADRQHRSGASLSLDVRADPRLGVRHHGQGRRESDRHLLVGRPAARAPRRARRGQARDGRDRAGHREPRAAHPRPRGQRDDRRGHEGGVRAAWRERAAQGGLTNAHNRPVLDDLHYLSIEELARRRGARQVSPVEVTETMLRRIERVDPALKSYALVTPELALAQARTAEQMIRKRQILSQLHGVPVAVKDLCWTEGIATAAGMPLHKDFVPAVDATVVRKLREAGAVLLGKLQLTEGAFADHHPDVPPPVNPWHRDHWSGASSSGSGVATAAGLCFGSLGSDTGGSIRFPAAANGVTGIKPTWGRVSRFGCFELAASLDHIGPMTRSAADAAAVLGVIAGADPNDPTALQD